MNLKRQFFFLHIYNFLVSFRVADGVWVVFLLARGFSLAQVGIAEGVFHVVSFLCEVPSGMLADLVGRKRTLALSGLFGTLSALTMAFSQDFFGVCLSMAFQALMYNLCSGTQEALTYDSLKALGQEGSYLKRNAWLMGSAQVASSLSSLLGGAAALLGYFPAYLITAACSAVCASAALALVEPQVTEAQRQRTEHPFAQLGPRFRAHLRESWGFFRRNPRAAYKILASAGAATPIYLTFMYLQQHLLDTGLPELFLGAALMSLGLLGTAGMALSTRVKGRLFPLAVGCGLSCGAATCLAGAPWWPLSLLGGALAQLVFSVLDLRVDAALNDDFPSDQRATLVSVNSMAYSLLMIAASPAAGAVGDVFGASYVFVFLGLGLAVCTAAGALWYHRRYRA